MKARPGVALMLVLWVIVFLTTITTGIALTTRSNSQITGNYRAGVVARYAAESGVTSLLRRRSTWVKARIQPSVSPSGFT